MADVRKVLRENLGRVEARIAAACARAGRRREHVTLVAITKYVPSEVARLLPELGVFHLGESRPQELWRKAAVIPEAHWHLVGHLQRNKVERTLAVARCIHSVDSLRLLDAIVQEAVRQQRSVELFLEFNLSGEEAKHGFAAKNLEAIAPALALAPPAAGLVRVVGLMTMAALDAAPDETRRTFVRLRELADELGRRSGDPEGFRMLSMGMTGDFEAAIEEGATHVRIGSALFAGLLEPSA